MRAFNRFSNRLGFLPALFAAFIAAAMLNVTAAGGAHAQAYLDAADWKEIETPPPPAFDVTKLVTFEVSSNSALTYGIDPAAVMISTVDGVVRYVLVAYSASGSKNIMYEGLRCSTGEVKTYARYTPDGRLVPATEPKWRSVFDISTPRHPLRFARAGACDSGAPVGTVRELVAKLKKPALRFADQ